TRRTQRSMMAFTSAGSRFIEVGRAKVIKFLTISPQRRLSDSTRSSMEMFSGSTVDWRDRRFFSNLAYRSHSFNAKHFVLRAAQLAGLFLYASFESTSPRINLFPSFQ